MRGDLPRARSTPPTARTTAPPRWVNALTDGRGRERGSDRRRALLHEPSIGDVRGVIAPQLLTWIVGQPARPGLRARRLSAVGLLQAVSRMGMDKYSSNADRMRLSRSFTFG